MQFIIHFFWEMKARLTFRMLESTQVTDIFKQLVGLHWKTYWKLRSWHHENKDATIRALEFLFNILYKSI